VLACLRQLAAGGVSDSIRLLMKGETLSQRQIKGLNLMNISQIKKGTNGITEIKFFDRLEAAKMLLDPVNCGQNEQNSLLDALRKSVEDEE
jgi:hypothetical protein